MKLLSSFEVLFKTMDEKQIIKGCLKGDRKSQKTMYEHYYATLFGIALRYSKNKEEAKDILHEAFIKIFSNLSQYSGKGAFEGWLKKIVINTAITQLQKFQKENFHFDIDEINEAQIQNNLTDFDEDEFTAEDAMELMQKLPDKYRIVMNLYAIEQYSHKEIGEMIGIGEGASKSRLLRARKLLVDLLQNYHDLKTKKNSSEQISLEKTLIFS